MATGDIYEDIPQAQAAARAGADVIAVIRSTGQSLLDYVPEGATRTGYAGTYATQENFRLMRAALDDGQRELGRYVRLTNYASGLCMPEIAVLAGLERLDMMLNDSMYGILFRDINPRRTFVDQRFSRQVHARAGIIINTGEDNYLTTADAVEEAHTVTVSQLLNEYFAKEAGLEDWQLGLGHAFEINPACRSRSGWSWRTRCSPATLFPDAPLKWMPPTKHMTGDVFRGYLLDGFFNLAGALTGQGILLVGMMTEAVVTPWLSDRDLALRNVRYVLDAAGGLAEDFRPPPGGFIDRRARHGARARRWTCSSGSPTTPTGCSRRSPTARSASRSARPTAARAWTAWSSSRAGAYNPAHRAARGGVMPDGSDRAAVRRHDRRRHGADVVHPAGAAMTEGPRAPRCSWPNKMGIDPALVVHAKAMGAGLHVLRRLRPGAPPGRPARRRGEERAYPLLGPTEINGAIKRGAAPASSSCSGPASAPTRTPWASTRSSTSRASRGRRAWSTTREIGREPRRPGLGARARREGPRRARPTPSSSPRSSRRRTRTCATPASWPPPSARRSGGQAPAAGRRWPRFDEAMAAELGVDKVFGKGTTPGEVARYLVSELAPDKEHAA